MSRRKRRGWWRKINLVRRKMHAELVAAMLGFIPSTHLHLKAVKAVGSACCSREKKLNTVILSPFVSLSKFILVDGETQTRQFKSHPLNGIKDVIGKIKKKHGSKCETNILMLKKGGAGWALFGRNTGSWHPKRQRVILWHRGSGLGHQDHSYLQNRRLANFGF